VSPASGSARSGRRTPAVKPPGGVPVGSAAGVPRQREASPAPGGIARQWPVSPPSPHGLRRRTTRQREAIAGALEASPGFLTAQELHGMLRSGGTAVGLTTVYRALQSLADVVRTAGGETAYRMCGAHHHHHLICRMCGRVEELVECRVESWARDLAVARGFELLAHHVELEGICAPCRADRAVTPKTAVEPNTKRAVKKPARAKRAARARSGAGPGSARASRSHDS